MWRRCGSRVWLILAFASLAAAQDKETTFKSYSRLVQVSVVVKRDGKQVRGLSRDDFSLLENGSPRPIASFEETSELAETSKGLQPPGTSPAPQVEPTNYSNAGNARGITVLMIDAINTRVLDQTYARSHLLRFLKETRFPTDHPVGLMVSARNGIKVIHHFTTDSSVLIRALQLAKPESPANASGSIESQAAFSGQVADTISALSAFNNTVDAPYEYFQCELATRDTVRALRGLAQALRGFPGRKTVLWATAGFSFSCPGSGVNFADLSARTFRELADANVSIYPVDARGLLAYDSITGASRMSGVEARNPGHYNLQKYSGWFSGFQNSLDSLKHTAEMTGGLAFYNTSGLSQALEKAVADASEYYVLGYYTQGGGAKQPEWRSIEVKSRVKGVTLRHRSGVYVLPSADTNKKDDLDLAQTSALDFSGVRFDLTWPAGSPPSATDFEINVDSKDVTISEDNQISLDVLVVERTDSGEVLLRKSNTISGKIKDVTGFRARPFHFSGRLDAISPGGNYRFIVRDNLAQRIGSITVKATNGLAEAGNPSR